MRPIRFLLDGKPVAVTETESTRTVLQYLREDLLRVGSKEGCAEGDCGACTVVIAELADAGLRYRAVNACIQFLPTLDGKALFTVESLNCNDGALHPVQQAMVDYHGSQCGFCTPGFVMSMFALYQNHERPTRAQIDDALSGNLCRCTGYRPIIDACLQLHRYPDRRHDPTQSIDQLTGLQSDQALTLGVGNGSYYAPTTIDALTQYYQQNPDAQILAGGTDVGLWVTKQLRELPKLVYLGNVAELHRLEIRDAFIEVGAAVTLTDAFEFIQQHYPDLGEMFRRFASVPVRNAGTLVGNVANGSPIGDSMPALIAIDSRVRLRLGGDERVLPLEDLYLDYMKNALRPGELIVALEIPLADPTVALRCYKISKRFDQDISALCAAFALQLDGDTVKRIRIGIGGMAAVVKSAPQTEKILRGKPWSEATIKAAMQQLQNEFTPLSDMRASAAYRRRVCANLLYRFYLQTRPRAALSEDASNVFAVTS